MKAVRIFTWAAIVLMSLHSLGVRIMIWLDSSHIVVKVLFFIALVVMVEFGIWAAAAGPSDVIRRLRDNPQDVFQEIKTSFLDLGLIHLLLLAFLVSLFLTR